MLAFARSQIRYRMFDLKLAIGKMRYRVVDGSKNFLRFERNGAPFDPDMQVSATLVRGRLFSTPIDLSLKIIRTDDHYAVAELTNDVNDWEAILETYKKPPSIIGKWLPALVATLACLVVAAEITFGGILIHQNTLHRQMTETTHRIQHLRNAEQRLDVFWAHTTRDLLTSPQLPDDGQTAEYPWNFAEFYEELARSGIDTDTAFGDLRELEARLTAAIDRASQYEPGPTNTHWAEILEVFDAMYQPIVDQLQVLGEQRGRIQEPSFDANDINNILIMLIVGAILLCLLHIYNFLRYSRPLLKLSDSIYRIINTNDDVIIPYTRKNDEIGNIAAALRELKEVIDLNVDLESIAEKAEREAAAERTAKHRRESEVADIVSLFDREVKVVIDSVVSQTAEAIRYAMKDLKEISDSNHVQSENLSGVVDTAVHTINALTDQATELIMCLTDIDGKMASSTTAFDKMIVDTGAAKTTVDQLTVHAGEIYGVVDLIRDIAQQIKLVALNAGIEATRAGESGRGFAVVASEIKNLTQQVERATEEVTQKISALSDATEQTVIAISSVNDTSCNISEQTKETIEEIQEQLHAVRTMVDQIRTADENIESVAGISKKVSQTAEFTLKATNELRSITGDMDQQSVVLSTQVERFIDQILGKKVDDAKSTEADSVELF